MRVLHIVPAIAPRYGGPSAAVLGMVRALRDIGVDPVIATTDADGPSRMAVELDHVTSYNGVSTIFFRRQFSEAYKYSRPLSDWLERNVRSFDVAHIHAVFSHSSIAAARACRRRYIPYVLQPHGSLDARSLRHSSFRKRIFWHLGVQSMVHGASALCCTSLDEQQRVRTTLNSQTGVHVVPLGVDEELMRVASEKPTLAPDHTAIVLEPYVLALGRVHPVKQLESVIEAFKIATGSANRERWRLIIAGDGDPDYVRQLKHRAARDGWAERIVFTGWLAGQRKHCVLRNAALVVSASNHENFGLSVAEAMAFGVPVLTAIHLPLAAEIAETSAGWVFHADGRSFSAALIEAMHDHSERLVRGERARVIARERFNWRGAAQRLATIYGEVSRSPATSGRVAGGQDEVRWPRIT